MREIIPFVKDVVFKDNIASICSISLEHEEKIFEGEISGDFIVFGDYKIHNDTTEKELFKYRLPFTAIIPDNLVKETIKVDIVDFTYEQIENDVIKVKIDFVLEGEERVDEPEILEESQDIDELLGINKDEKDELLSKIEKIDETRNEEEQLDLQEEIKIEEACENYVIYHIHIVSEGENLEDIIKHYDTNLDNIKIYNDITKINIGDKIIIPEYKDE